MRIRPSSLRIRSVGAAGDIELPSGANGLQARQGVQDSRREVQSRVLQLHLVRKIHHHPLKDCRKSERVASLSSTAAGLLRDFFKSSSRALNFKKSLRRQGISFRRCVIDRSHPLTVCQRYCGRRLSLSAPSTFAMFVWERLVHPRFTGLTAREARLATPYGQDRHGHHSADAPLRPRQTCRERGKASPCVA